MARGVKRERLELEASQFQAQLNIKRMREARDKKAQEAADDATAPDGVRSMRTQPKTGPLTDSSRAMPYFGQTPEVIGLTSRDELKDGFPAHSSRSKGLQDQAEEQSHSRYYPHNKTIKGEKSMEVKVPNTTKGKEQWTHSPAPPVTADTFAMQSNVIDSTTQAWHDYWAATQAWHDQWAANQAWHDHWAANQAWHDHNAATQASHDHYAVMFTVPEAMAATTQPQPPNTITYDLQTGEYMSYRK
jgi:hypothetical protein